MKSKPKKLRSLRRYDPFFLSIIPPLAALIIKFLMLSCRVIKVKGQERLWGADRCWIFNTWDRYLIPKPFARVVIYNAEPIWVPRSANGEELEGYRRLLEDSINRTTRWCDEYFGHEKPWRKVKKRGSPEFRPIQDE